MGCTTDATEMSLLIAGIFGNPDRIFNNMCLPGVYAVLRGTHSSWRRSGYHRHWYPILLPWGCMEKQA